MKLEALLNSDEPIYVINNTKERGRVVLTLEHPGSGRSESVKIPVTWVPICLTEIVPRELLKASLDFRNYVAKGILKIVPAEEAKKVLSKPEAKEELKRIYESQYAQDVEVTEEEFARIEEKPEVNPRVQDILIRLESGSLSYSAAISTLKSLADTLTEQDLSFIIANSPSDRVRTWAEKELSKKSQA